MEDYSKYSHTPAHLAVAQKDHSSLKKLISSLPRLAKSGSVNTEAESVASELDADAVSAVIDRRDVPGHETPLHLAVRLKDPVSVEILMAAGADWSLQNDHGWSALQEAVCNREENIAMIIARHYQPFARAKLCRRLPRIVSSANRIRDFYTEINFHLESSVIPFIGRIAPSDTYRIWKRGSNLRVDMTIAGFNGFRIQRSDQTFMFLGDGYFREEGNVSLPPGSLIVLSHKEKKITDALEGAGGEQPSEAEVAHDVELMFQTNMYRLGIDVTQAKLVPHLKWLRQERTEVVGQWKSKVYDMLHVMVSMKSRRVQGAMTDKEFFSSEQGVENGGEQDEYDDVLTPEEKIQLNSALRNGNSEIVCEDEEREIHNENSDSGSFENSESNGKDKKTWFGWNKKGLKTGSNNDPKDSKILKKFSKLNETQKASSETTLEKNGESKKGNDNSVKKKGSATDAKQEYECKKRLRPILWLTPDFPLKTEELVPLLDVLANKVKVVRRLRQLLTTKLPVGTFPVKLTIPILPTIRVLVTFTKFEELQPLSEEFSTSLSSPAHFQDSKSKEPEGSTSWISWMKGNRGGQSSDTEGRSFRYEMDPFNIPADYTWVDVNEKKRRMIAKKAKIKIHKKQYAAAAAARSTENGARQPSEDLK